MEISLADEHMVETLGSRRSSGRRRNPRSPSPVPSPRSPSLPSSPIPSPTPSLTNHNKHSVHKNWSLPEEEPNGSRKLPTKDAKTPKVEPGKEGVNHPNAESMEAEQGRKVKPMVASSTKSLTNSSTDQQSSVNNSFPHRKRERTPSPTPSLPG